MWGKAGELRLSVVMRLRKGLSLIRGMRRSLTEEEQHKIAGQSSITLKATTGRWNMGRRARATARI
jgi:hypothetical protein